MKTQYELKRFKSSEDKNLTKALFIYVNNIEPILRTDSNEIIFWLDNYHKYYVDTYILFGFYLNNHLIGYSELVYFKEQKVVFVDYVVIEKDCRRNNTFYEFVEQIKDYLEKENLIYDYILAEVGGFTEKMEPTSNTRNIIRLLKLIGFGVVKTSYYHPKLGKNNYESGLHSVLMLYTPNELKAIKKETYFIFLTTIYFNHYMRWYKPFMNDKEQMQYADELKHLLSKSEIELKRREIIEINGFPNSYAVGTITPELSKYKRFAKSVAILILFIAFLLFFGLIHVFIKSKYSIDVTAQTYIILASGLGVLFIISIFTEDKTKSLTKIVETLLKKLTG